MRKQRSALIAWIALLVLSLAVIASFIALRLLGILEQDKYRFVLYIYIVVLPLVVCAFGILLTYYLHLRKNSAILTKENMYNLGRESHFFNYDMFARRVKSVYKRNHKKNTQYVVTFTTSHYSMMKNSSRNPAVTELNGYVADFLVQLFEIEHVLGRNKAVFCFHRGQFVLFLVGPEEKVREVVEIIQNKIYALVQDNSIKIFVQPFFGIAEVKKEDESLPMTVDNAILARDLSEKNFDSITLYKESYRKAASKSELQEIKAAIENNELVIFYQPKYNLASKTFISSEALVRWNSPKYGMVSPAKFIEKAELGGLIHELDMYVFKKVCAELSEMKEAKKRLIPVSVNFSIYEFYSPTFLQDIDEIIKSSNINPSLLEIEITETTSQANPFLAVSILKKLKEKGLKILMDDFGLGYSNLGTLNKVPFDTIKIDKSFIDGIVSDIKAREIVKLLISLSKSNGMEVIAEGVDKPEQVEILKKIRCDTIQGYYYSQPLSRADYEKFLVENPFEKKEDDK